jgi:hypothetical protein
MLSDTDNSAANSVAIWAALTYDIIAATNSSPQTAEINAGSRAETLMKWVHIGEVQALGFILVGMALDKKRWPPMLGGGLSMILLYAQYKYALNCGLNSDKKPTETHGSWQVRSAA